MLLFSYFLLLWLKKTNSILVATVNVYNATSSKIDDNTYKISYDIWNTNNIQSGVRYGISLKNASTSQDIDTFLENKSITLLANNPQKVEIDYTLPAYLPTGTYTINAVSRNANGLPLANVPVITNIVINNDVVLDFKSCTTNNTQNGAGAVLKSGESVNINCKIVNNSNKDINNLSIKYITHKGYTLFGDIVANETFNLPTLTQGENDISFTANTVAGGNNFFIDLFLLNNNNQKISKSLSVNYSIASENPIVSISNFWLDKSDYTKGDTANIKIFWQPTQKSDYTLSAKINDSKNNLCGKTERKVSDFAGFGNSDLKVKIDKDCAGAIASFEILDKNGAVLVSDSINTNSLSVDVSIDSGIQNEESKVGSVKSVSGLSGWLKSIDKNWYIVIFIAVLVLIGWGIMHFRKHEVVDNGNILKK